MNILVFPNTSSADVVRMSEKRNNVERVSENEMRGLRQSLSALGFSQSDTSVYLELLSGSSSTTQQLLHSTRLPPNSVQQSLWRLKTLHLVNEVAAAGKIRLYAVDPKVAWGAFLCDESWRVTADSSVSKGQHISSMAEVSERAAMIDEIANVATMVYKTAGRSRLLRRTVFDSSSDFALCCSEALMGAQKRVIAVERKPQSQQVALFWPAILDMTARGVVYTRYAAIEELFYHGIEIVTRDVEALGIDLQIARVDEISSSLFLIDGETLFLYSNTEEEALFSARVSRNPEVIDRYASVKLRLLEASAIPFARIKDAVLLNVDHQRTAAQAIGASMAVFERVARLGKFARLTAKERVAADFMTKAGILRSYSEGYGVAILSNRELSAML